MPGLPARPGLSRVCAGFAHDGKESTQPWRSHATASRRGLCQREGGTVEVIRPGDHVFFEPGENHWHGAAPTRFMTHVAMHLADDADEVDTRGAHVSDDEYGRAPDVSG